MAEFRPLGLSAEAGKNEGISSFSALLGLSSSAEASLEHWKGNAVVASSVPACDDHLNGHSLGFQAAGLSAAMKFLTLNMKTQTDPVLYCLN